MSLILTIDGVQKQLAATAGSVSIHAVANGIDTLTVTILSIDGSYRPSLDAPVSLVWDNGVDPAVLLFGGLITSDPEEGDAASTIEVTASDWGVYASYRYLNETIPAGTLKSALTRIALKLNPEITLDPAQPDGPDVPEMAFPYSDASRCDVALQEYAKRTGWVIRKNYDGLLGMHAPTDLASPIDITEGDERLGKDFKIEPTRDDTHANRVIVVVNNTPTTVPLFQTFVADGVATSWLTDFEADPSWIIGAFYLNDEYVPIANLETDAAAGGPSSIWAWLWDPATHRVFQRTGDAPAIAGTTIKLPYMGLATQQSNRQDIFVGDGSTTTFVLTAAYVADRGTVLVNGVSETLAPGATWTVDRPANSIIRNAGAPALAADVRIVYDAALPPALQAIANNVPAQAAPTGVREGLEPSDNITNIADAQAFAAIAVAARSQTIRRASYSYLNDGVAFMFPGETQHIDVPFHDVDADFLITEVVTTDLAPNQLQQQVTAVEGSVVQGIDRNLYKQWLEKGNTGSATSASLSAPTGGLPSPPERSVQIYTGGRLDSSPDVLIDKDGSGDTYGVEVLAARLASLAPSQNLLALALGNRAFPGKELTFWQRDSDGNFYIELDGATLSLNAYGTNGNITVKGVNAVLRADHNTTGSFALIGSLVATESQFIPSSRHTSNFTIDAGYGGGGLPNFGMILDGSTPRTATLPAITADTNTLGIADTYGRVLIFTNVGTASWTIATTGTDLIGTSTASSAGTFTLAPGQSIAVFAAVSAVSGVRYWRIFGSHGIATSSGAGSGDVVGPSSSTAGDLALFDGATGKLLKTGSIDSTLAFSGTVLGVSGVSYQRVVLTLTDAQIKTLPSTTVQLVAAPAAGFRVKPLSMTINADTAAGAYVGIDTVYATLVIQTTDGTWLCPGVSNDDDGTANSLLLAQLTRVLGTTLTSYFDMPVPNFSALNGAAIGDGEYVKPEVGSGASNFDGKAVELFMDNNGNPADLTGGHAANTLKITMVYTLEAV